MGILVVTGIGSSPCSLEDLKPTLDSTTLNEMQFGPQEQFLIGTKKNLTPCSVARAGSLSQNEIKR